MVFSDLGYYHQDLKAKKLPIDILPDFTRGLWPLVISMRFIQKFYSIYIESGAKKGKNIFDTYGQTVHCTDV